MLHDVDKFRDRTVLLRDLNVRSVVIDKHMGSALLYSALAHA